MRPQWPCRFQAQCLLPPLPMKAIVACSNSTCFGHRLYGLHDPWGAACETCRSTCLVLFRSVLPSKQYQTCGAFTSLNSHVAGGWEFKFTTTRAANCAAAHWRASALLVLLPLSYSPPKRSCRPLCTEYRTKLAITETCETACQPNTMHNIQPGWRDMYPIALDTSVRVLINAILEFGLRLDGTHTTVRYCINSKDYSLQNSYKIQQLRRLEH
jgi:hypothetical protein